MDEPTRLPRTYESYRSRKYVPELDGVRALSVLLVISTHMYDAAVWRWLAGEQGVEIFFVLSGYLITMLALCEEDARGALSLAAFYVRRCFRIFPLYYLTLGLYCVLILALGLAPTLRGSFESAIPYYVCYGQEPLVHTHLIAGRTELPYLHTWSLGVEEKFYLVWPVLAFVLWRAGGARRTAAAAGLAAGLALAPPVLTLFTAHGQVVGRYLIPYFHLLVGCLLAMLLYDRRWFERLRFLGAGAWTALACALFGLLHLLKPWLPPSYFVQHARDSLYSLAAAAALAGVLLGGGRVQRLLRARPLVFVGKLSYGVYLLHVLAIIAANKVIPSGSGRVGVAVLAYLLAAGLSIAAAWVLAVLVEEKCRALGRRWSEHILDRSRRPSGAVTPVGQRRRTPSTTVGQR